MPVMHNYLFDVKLFARNLVASIRLDSPDEKTARANLAELLDCATANFGSINGEPILAEVSLDTENGAELVAVDYDLEESASAFIHAHHNPKVQKVLSQIGRALEAWLPVRDLIAEMATQIQGDRDSFVQSYCYTVPFGQPYDIDTADADERASLDEMTRLLEQADEVLGTDFARPTINDWFKDLREDTQPETAPA